MDPVVDVIVVIDTGFIRGGDFKSNVLMKIARRLRRRGCVVVVPEVVVWEWAEHAHNALTVLRQHCRHASHRVDPALGLPIAEPALPTVEELVQSISRLVESMDIDVRSTDPDSAVEAIRQQVLQVGHGSRTEGVKTGAADVLVLSAVEQAAEDVRVVLCSRDRALAAMAESLPRVRAVQAERELWEMLLKVAPAMDDVASRVSAYLLKAIQKSINTGTEPLPLSGFQPGEALLRQWGLRATESVQVDANLIAVSDVQVIEPDLYTEEGFMTTDVVVRGVIGVWNWYFGGEDSTLTDEYAEDEVDIHVSASIDLDSEYNPVDFTVDDLLGVESIWEEVLPRDEVRSSAD